MFHLIIRKFQTNRYLLLQRFWSSNIFTMASCIKGGPQMNILLYGYDLISSSTRLSNLLWVKTMLFLKRGEPYSMSQHFILRVSLKNEGFQESQESYLRVSGWMSSMCCTAKYRWKVNLLKGLDSNIGFSARICLEEGSCFLNSSDL